MVKNITPSAGKAGWGRGGGDGGGCRREGGEIFKGAGWQVVGGGGIQILVRKINKDKKKKQCQKWTG